MSAGEARCQATFLTMATHGGWFEYGFRNELLKVITYTEGQCGIPDLQTLEKKWLFEVKTYVRGRVRKKI